MDVTDLRVALVSGNYNMVRDGPTQALNRLVGYVLEKGGAVRVFAPTVENPQVDPVGELISIPSIAIPGRSEYRVPLGLTGERVVISFDDLQVEDAGGNGVEAYIVHAGLDKAAIDAMPRAAF